MSQEPEVSVDNKMGSEYDFSIGVRGKCHKAYLQPSNVMVLYPDIAEIF